MAFYGIQLYSLRDLASEDFPAAVRAAAEMGYSSVEFAGFFGYDAKDVKALLDETGLKLAGTHTGWTELLPENIEKTIEYHKIIGNKNLIIPGYDFSTAEKLNELAKLMNFAAPLLAKEGIRLGYHNHYKEFMPNSDGVLFYDVIRSQTDVLFEIDTFWAYYAGKDPVKVMEDFSDRLMCIHLKDGVKATKEGRSVGEGDAPVIAVIDKALEMNVPMIVESEGLSPSGKEEAKRCIDFLKKLGK